MHLGVLGPVALDSGGTVVALGGPKQRLVLGLLTAGRGRVVTVDELIDGLWPEGPQARPRKTVQVYVTRLRQAFGDDTGAIHSEAAGYRLDPGALDVDADQFERSMSAAVTDRNDETAVTQLRSALGLWRGDAYADLRDCAAIVPSAVRLDELRLSAMHDLFEREIRLRPRSVIADLEQALEDNPLHEGFAAQLMTAQYRSGRQADALQTYQGLRRRLGNELGLGPGAALRELEGRILRHEITVAPAPKLPEPERQRRRVTIVVAEFSVESDNTGEVDVDDEFTLVTPVRSLARSRILGQWVIAWCLRRWRT